MRKTFLRVLTIGWIGLGLIMIAFVIPYAQGRPEAQAMQQVCIKVYLCTVPVVLGIRCWFSEEGKTFRIVACLLLLAQLLASVVFLFRT